MMATTIRITLRNRICSYAQAMLLGGLVGLASASAEMAYPSDGANYQKFAVQQPPLLPLPQSCQWADASVKLDKVCLFLPENATDKDKIKFIQSQLAKYLKAHKVAAVAQGTAGAFPMKFELGSIVLPAEAKEPWQRKEAYTLSVSAKGARIKAEDEKGLYYGLQTLMQLIIHRQNQTSIAACQITDWPDYEVRGFMNDVGRNFMPIEYIMDEIESMAQLKYNVYHFHFTENYGWRLESKIYPELNLPENQSRWPGKNYSQEEFKALVKACALRNIQLIPEMDMPGHTAAFRKALGLKNMENEKATKALEELIAEMAALVPAKEMPYIHIGTDEVKAHERVSAATIKRYYDAVEKAGRQVIRWQHGLATPKGVNRPIEQIWTGRQLRRSHPTKGARYIDSHETYLNHLDPFEQAATFYYRRPCPYKHAHGMGVILCAWPDLPMTDSRDHMRQTPIFGSLAFASESLWNNPHPSFEGDIYKDPHLVYFSNLPSQQSELLKGFAAYEDRVLAFRDRFMRNKEFAYVRQANVPWKIIGPFPHDGQVETVFPPEEELLKGKKASASYDYKGENYTWHPEHYTGHTIAFKHYCDYPTTFNGGGWGYPHRNHTYYALQYIYSPKAQTVPFWIGAQTWATSDRRNGPSGTKGEWLYTKAQFYVNGKAIDPPNWKNPNGKMEHYVDENYHYRKPTPVKLKKGWNQILVKNPSLPKLRRWMFTFAPIDWAGGQLGQNVKEAAGLRFSVDPSKSN